MNDLQIFLSLDNAGYLSAIDSNEKATLGSIRRIEQGFSGLEGRFPGIGRAISSIAPNVRALGGNLQEAAGAMALLIDAGVRSSSAATFLNTALSRLSNPTRRAAELMQSLNIQAFNSQGNFVGLSSLVGQLGTAFQGMSAQQRQAALTTLFGSAQAGRFNILLQKGQGELNRYTNAVGRAQSRTAAFAQSLREIPGLGNLIRLATNPVVALGAAFFALTGFIGGSIREFGRLDQALSGVNAIVDPTGRATAAFASLREEAQRLGVTTEFSSVQAARSMEFLARAGLSANEILGATGSTLALATVGQLDLGRASDIASDTLRQFNIEADRLGEVVDVIAKTTTSSNSNVEQFAEAMKFLGPTAQALNVELSESSAVIGLLANSGLKGSVATRAFQTALTRLAAPPKKAAAEIRRLGIEAFDLEGNFVGMAGLIEQLERAFVGLTPRQRQAALTTIFGAEAIQEFNILLNEGSGRIREYTAEIEAAAEGNGAFAEAIREQRLDNLPGDITRLSSAFSGLREEVGAIFNPLARDLVQGLTAATRGAASFVVALGDIDRVIEENAVAFTLVATAILAYNTSTIAAIASSLSLANVQRVLTAALTLTRTTITRLGSALVAAFSNPLTAAIVGIGLITAGIIALVQESNKYTISAREQADITQQVAASFATEKQRLDALVRVLQSDTESRQRKVAAAKALNQEYGDYLPFLVTEKTSQEDLARARNIATEALLKSIVARRQEQEISGIVSEIAALAQRNALLRQGNLEAQTTSQSIRTLLQAGVSGGFEGGFDRAGAAIAENGEEIDGLRSKLEGINGVFEEVSNTVLNTLGNLDFGFGVDLDLDIESPINQAQEGLRDTQAAAESLDGTLAGLGLNPALQSQLESVSAELARVRERAETISPQVDFSALSDSVEQGQGDLADLRASIESFTSLAITPQFDGAGLQEAAQDALAELATAGADLDLELSGLSFAGIDSGQVQELVAGLNQELSGIVAADVSLLSPESVDNSITLVNGLENEIISLASSIAQSGNAAEFSELQEGLNQALAVFDSFRTRIDSATSLEAQTVNIEVAGLDTLENAELSLLSLQANISEIIGITAQAPEGSVFEGLSDQAQALRPEIDAIGFAIRSLEPGDVEGFAAIQADLQAILPDVQLLQGEFAALSGEIAQAGEDSGLGTLDAQADLLEEAVQSLTDRFIGLGELGAIPIADLEQKISDLKEAIKLTDPNTTIPAILTEQVQLLESFVERAQTKISALASGIDLEGLQVISALDFELPEPEVVPEFTAQVETLQQASERLGLDWDIVNRHFSDTGELFDFLEGPTGRFFQLFSNGVDRAAQKTIIFKDLWEQTAKAIGEAVARDLTNAFATFGEEIGKSIALGNRFADSVGGAFRRLLFDLLTQVPRTVGLILIQSALSPAAIASFPANLGLLAGGLALIGASSLLSNLPSFRKFAGLEELGEGNTSGFGDFGAQSAPNIPSGVTGLDQTSLQGGLATAGEAFDNGLPPVNVNVYLGNERLGEEFLEAVTVNNELQGHSGSNSLSRNNTNVR